MFIPFGNRTIRVKRYTDNRHYCKSCNYFDLKVNVSKEFFHVFFIPFVPTGITTAKMYCNQCKVPQRIDSVQRHYENTTKAPLYL